MANQKRIVFFDIEKDKFFRYTAYLIENNLIAWGLEGYDGVSMDNEEFWKKEKIGYARYEKEMKIGEKIALFDNNNFPIVQTVENICENNPIKISKFPLEGIIKDVHLIK